MIVAVAAGAFKGSGSSGPGAAGTAYRTSIAVVKRETLTSQSSLSGTLADSGSYTIVNQATGTVTTLPAVGKTVRQGGTLYQVSGTPVVLLYGNVPDYRDMSEGLTGADVREFNKALIALGYTTRADVLAAGLGMGYFSAATATAWEDYQTALGDYRPLGDRHAWDRSCSCRPPRRSARGKRGSRRGPPPRRARL